MVTKRLSLPVVLLVVIAFFGWVGPSSDASAQSETELRSTADYDYGQQMRFRLQASNLGEVAGVTLFFRPHTSAEAYGVDIPTEPGSEIDVSYALDLTQTKLPPFSSVAYWWELTRADGATFRVPERTISYVDDQFSWQWVSKADPEGGGVVTIQWTGENSAVGDTTFDIVLQAMDRLSPYIPVEEAQPFNVFIYPSSADLGSAMRLAGQTWQPGQTYPELGVVLLTAVNQATAEAELTVGVGRELTDLLLYQALGEEYTRVPQWLRSGLSVIAAGGADPRASAALSDAVGAGTTMPLSELCQAFPTDETAIGLAQTQSAVLVAAIGARYGPGSIAGLIESFAGGATCDEAFSMVLQATPAEVERSWMDQFQTADPQQNRIGQAIIWVLLVLAGFGFAGLLVARSSSAARSDRR